MRKILSLSMWALAALSMLAACTKSTEPEPTPGPGPEPQPETKLELALSVGEVTSTTVTFTVTPNKDDAPFYAKLCTLDEVAEDRDVAMTAALMITDGEAYLGAKTITVEDLTAETPYAVLYFGYDAAAKAYTTDYYISDAIVTADFEIVESIDMQLVEGSITWREAYVKMLPSDESMEYVFDIVEKAKWDELYAEDPESVVAARIAGWEQDVLDGIDSNPELDTWQKYMHYYQQNATKTVMVSEYYNLRWATDYVMYAFGMNDEGFQTAYVSTLEFTTATPEPSQNTFAVEIGELTESSVAFTVTTTNNDPYFLTIQDKRYVDRFFGEGKTETWEDMIWDLTFVKTDEQIQDLVFSGSQSLTNADINKNVDTLHEYQVVIWGFNNGPTTEVYVSDVFQPQAEVIELSLYLTIDNVTADTLSATISASHDEPAYYVDCITAAEFGDDYGLTYINALYGNLTEEDLLYGTQTVTFEGLQPETEYYVIAFGYDIETGDPTTYLFYKNERTMPMPTEDLFTLAVNDITWRNAQISVATEYAGSYIYGLFTAEEYAAYADAEAIFADRKAGWESSAEWYDGATWLTMMNYDLISGNTTFNVSEEIETLTYGESYVFYCMGVTAEGDIDTAMAVAEFTTLAPEASDCTFEITIDAMTKSSVNFTVTPSNLDEQYYVTVQRVSVLNGYGPDKDKSYEDLIRYLIPDSDYTLEARLFEGEQSLTNSSVGATVNGFYEYRVVVWGFNNGPTTTVYMSEAFKPADPE